MGTLTRAPGAPTEDLAGTASEGVAENVVSDPAEDLAEDLTGVIRARLIEPLDALFGGGEQLREQLPARTREWAAALLGDDDQAATLTAIRLVRTLYPGEVPFDPPAARWNTPFGRVVARRVGHPQTRTVPVSVAAAMLGITRQGVHDLANRGKLERDPAGGITADSVRVRLAVRPGGSGGRN